MVFLYIFLKYLQAEFDLSTQSLVAGMANNISKTLFFPIWLSLMTEMVWERDFGLSFLFVHYCFHSFKSCLKVDGLGRSSL